MSDWRYPSASDLGLAGNQRRSSVHRETGLMASGLRLLWQAYVRTVLRTWNRMEIHGIENLPAKPPFVLIANHTSHLDAIVLSSILPWRWRNHASPLAAGDYFFASPPIAGFAAGILNALPIWRERQRGQRHELGDLRERLINQSAIYIVFPEGSRSRDGAMHLFKPGFATLVAGTGIPVLPCQLDGTHAAMPPDKYFVRPRKITLRIGQPMTFENVENHASGWRTIASLVQKEVATLERLCASEKRRARRRRDRVKLLKRYLRLTACKQIHPATWP